MKELFVVCWWRELGVNHELNCMRCTLVRALVLCCSPLLESGTMGAKGHVQVLYAI